MGIAQKRILNPSPEVKWALCACFSLAHVFSCPGSSLSGLGQSVNQWVSATIEFRQKEWLLRLETLQTFDQHNVWTKRQKSQNDEEEKKITWQTDNMTKRLKDEKTKGKKDKMTKRPKKELNIVTSAYLLSIPDICPFFSTDIIFGSIFRCASISSTYPCQSVRW